MRKISEIIIHCADTPAGRNDKAADIKRWHLARGFKDIGYHYVIDIDGTIEAGRPTEKEGAHCTGHNAQSIGICYIGGQDAQTREPSDTRTDAQKASLLLLLKFLRSKYPSVKIYGHRDFANKSCPCFDAKTEYENI